MSCINHAFLKDIYFCIIDKTDDEMYEHFIIRGKYVINTLPKTNDDYINSINNSKLYLYKNLFNL